MEPTTPKQNIRWTPEETRQIAKAYVELRFRDMSANALALLKKAQCVLPDNRQRELISFTQAGSVPDIVREYETLFNRGSMLVYEVHTNGTPKLVFGTPEIAPCFVVQGVQAPTAQPAAAAAAAAAPSRELVITIRQPQPDPADVLTKLPDAVLYGAAWNRLAEQIRASQAIPLPKPVADPNRVWKVAVVGAGAVTGEILKRKATASLRHVELTHIGLYEQWKTERALECDHIVIDGSSCAPQLVTHLRGRVPDTVLSVVDSGTADDLYAQLVRINALP